jgi:hypothetical protein
MDKFMLAFNIAEQELQELKIHIMYKRLVVNNGLVTVYAEIPTIGKQGRNRGKIKLLKENGWKIVKKFNFQTGQIQLLKKNISIREEVFA